MSRKKIGITLKVLEHPEHDEIMTCIDVEWINLLLSLDFIPTLIPLTSIEHTCLIWNDLELNGLILSGGNTLSVVEKDESEKNVYLERDIFEKSLLEMAIKKDIPVLGVCRGLQVINTYFNGGLVRFDGQIGKRQKIISLKKNDFKFPEEVTCYHNYIVTSDLLGDELIPLAHDINGNIQALSHSTHKVLGLMWHPEREQSEDYTSNDIIREHLNK